MVEETEMTFSSPLLPKITLTFSVKRECPECQDKFILLCNSRLIRAWIEVDLFKMEYRSHVLACRNHKVEAIWKV